MVRRVAEYLYLNTPVMREECAEMLGVPDGTLKNWWAKMPLPPHRGGVQGKAPADLAAVLGEECEQLRAQVEELRRKLESVAQESPTSVDGLMRRAKERLADTMEAPGTKAGEIAQVLRALAEAKREEVEASMAERVQVIHYVPDPIPGDEWDNIIAAACPRKSPKSAGSSPANATSDAVEGQRPGQVGA